MAIKKPKPKQVPLTKRRQAYVDQFKPTSVMRGKPLNYNVGNQVAYSNALSVLTKRMTREVQKELVAFFKTETAKQFLGTATDATISSQARILTTALTKKFNQLFAQNAKPMAERMTEQASKASKANLFSSMQELTGGLSLKTNIMNPDLEEVVMATVVENVGLIKDVSNRYLQNVQGAVMRSITTGNGLQDLVPALQREEGVTLRRARNIAIDQTRKAYNNLNRGRMQAMGLKQFEWLHTGGAQKPRPLHLQLSGQVFSFDDLPVIDDKTGERGIPGQLINCGCRMRPVISFEKGKPTDGAAVTDNPEGDE